MCRRIPRRKSLRDNARSESGRASERRRSLRMRELEGKGPRLRDEIVAETVMRFLLHQAETGLLVEVPGGIETLVGPERDLPVARLSREADALGHEAPADAESSRGRLDEEQPELGDGRGLPDQEDAADVLAIPLGDPASLPLRIEVSEEPGRDLGDQRLELRIPAVLFRVDGRRDAGRPIRCRRADGAAGGRAPPRRGGRRADARSGSSPRRGGAGRPCRAGRASPAISSCERRLSEAKVSCPLRVRRSSAWRPVGRGEASLEQPAVPQPLDQPAQVSRVEAQLLAQLARRTGPSRWASS